MSLGELFFKMRGYTPVPFLLVGLILADPQKDLFIFGILLVLFGEFMRIWGVSYAGGATRTREAGAAQLVSNGPFAHMRNPLYFGNMFMYVGAAILSGAWLPYLMYLVIFFFSIQYAFIVKHEEGTLVELFGDEFERYRNEVPRFFPRISRYPYRSSIKPDLSAALRSEKSTFLNMLIFIVLISIRWYFM